MVAPDVLGDINRINVLAHCDEGLKEEKEVFPRRKISKVLVFTKPYPHHSTSTGSEKE